LSQERLAEGTSLHWSALGQIERGARAPGLPTIVKLAAALGVDPSVLVEGLRDFLTPDEGGLPPGKK